MERDVVRGMDSFVAFDEILKLAQANEVSARVRCWNARGTLVEQAPLGAVVFCCLRSGAAVRLCSFFPSLPPRSLCVSCVSFSFLLRECPCVRSLAFDPSL